MPQRIGAKVVGFQSIRFVCVVYVDAVKAAGLLSCLGQTQAESKLAGTAVGATPLSR